MAKIKSVIHDKNLELDAKWTSIQLKKRNKFVVSSLRHDVARVRMFLNFYDKTTLEVAAQRLMRVPCEASCHTLNSSLLVGGGGHSGKLQTPNGQWATKWL